MILTTAVDLDFPKVKKLKQFVLMFEPAQC